MNFQRSSGILLHPVSLPGSFGVGDLGEEAYEFADFLASTSQSLWQVLPLGPTGYGNSPYQCFSAFAGNPLLISPRRLVEEGMIESNLLENSPSFPEEQIDYEKAQEFKLPLLCRAFDNFNSPINKNDRRQFEEFCVQEESWLDDYALYSALKDAHNGGAWNSWEPELARRDTVALAKARQALSEEIEARKFYQYLFFAQWRKLKMYCNERGVSLIGDIPIFVAHDSADVWTNPEQFKLDEHGNPTVVAGVPPDYFSSTGQLWGNPLYNWERMRAEGFRWWVDRIRATMRMVDILRIDHFRGFAACWEIPGGDKTAERGRWVEAPGRELFDTIKRSLGDLPILAEDLGVITPDVERLRDAFGFPGMRILQFAFSSGPGNRDLPHNYIPNVVVYTGTHDNDTTLGWFSSVEGAGSTRDAGQIAREREFCLKYLNSDGKDISLDFIRAAMSSVARIAIFPLQDVLGLGTTARMNLPGTTEGNWAWRFRTGALSNEVQERLKHLTDLYGRTKASES